MLIYAIISSFLAIIAYKKMQLYFLGGEKILQ